MYYIRVREFATRNTLAIPVGWREVNLGCLTNPTGLGWLVGAYQVIVTCQGEIAPNAVSIGIVHHAQCNSKSDIWHYGNFHIPKSRFDPLLHPTDKQTKKGSFEDLCWSLFCRERTQNQPKLDALKWRDKKLIARDWSCVCVCVCVDGSCLIAFMDVATSQKHRYYWSL